MDQMCSGVIIKKEKTTDVPIKEEKTTGNELFEEDPQWELSASKAAQAIEEKYFGCLKE